MGALQGARWTEEEIPVWNTPVTEAEELWNWDDVEKILVVETEKKNITIEIADTVEAWLLRFLYTYG